MHTPRLYGPPSVFSLCWCHCCCCSCYCFCRRRCCSLSSGGFPHQGYELTRNFQGSTPSPISSANKKSSHTIKGTRNHLRSLEFYPRHCKQSSSDPSNFQKCNAPTSNSRDVMVMRSGLLQGWKRRRKALLRKKKEARGKKVCLVDGLLLLFFSGLASQFVW